MAEVADPYPVIALFRWNLLFIAKLDLGTNLRKTQVLGVYLS